MIQLLRNVRLAASTARQHLTDDPVMLFLQTSRRLPVGMVRPIARLTCALAPKSSVAISVLLASLARGDGSDVKRRLRLAADLNTTGEQARRLADVALAANLPELADVHLSAAQGAPGLKPALARRFWYDGALSDAVEILRSSGEAELPRRERLAGELRVLEGATPSLSRQGNYVPVAGRVLHLLTNSLPHTSSGYAQRSHSILLAQQEAGWDVLAATRLGYPVQVGKLMARSSDVVDGVRYRRLLPARLATTMDARLQQQAEELLRVALDFKPSVLHTTTHYANGMVVRAVAEALGIPWVYEVRGQLADTWASTRGPAAHDSEKYRLFQQREAEIMQAADLVVTLGEAMKVNIVASGVAAEKILIAPNAIGGRFLLEPRSTAEARHDLGLPEDGQYIGTISSLVAYEGIEDLIAAFALLADGHPDLRLLIVGDGVSTPSLQEQARQTGLRDRIVFTGRVPQDRAVLYHQALDIFVVPRKDLGVTRSVTPLKPVEALASARPVIASDLPALREIVTDGRTGIFAKPGDRDDLAEKLTWLLGSRSTREEFGTTGRSEVLRDRTWASNAERFAGEYDRLIRGQK